MTRVLVVDDEHALLRALAMNLTARGYEVIEAATGTQALTAAASRHPDVILLDLGLPDIAGVDVIRAVRAYSDIPIVVLSARTESHDKVMALDLGANDYVTKPFNIEELLARLRVVTRRTTPVEEVSVTQVGILSVDLVAKVAHDADGIRIHFTPTEWHLLEALITQPERLVTGHELLSRLRGRPDHTDPSYLRTYVAQLRRKVEPNPRRPRHIITEPGMGYRFQP